MCYILTSRNVIIQIMREKFALRNPVDIHQMEIGHYVHISMGGEEMINLREDTSLIVCAVRYALGRESYISYVVPSEVRLILPQVTDGILDALRNDVSDWLVRHQDNWTAKDWERLYEAIVREQEKRKWINGKNNTEGNNSPALR